MTAHMHDSNASKASGFRVPSTDAYEADEAEVPRMSSLSGPRDDVYFSTDKVDKDFEAIPSSAIARLLDRRLKLRVGPVEVRWGAKQGAVTRNDKLRAVMACYEQEGRVGTTNDPRKFFAGSLPMRWDIVPFEFGDMVFFCSVRRIPQYAADDEAEMVVLGGSSWNVESWHPRRLERLEYPPVGIPNRGDPMSKSSIRAIFAAADEAYALREDASRYQDTDSYRFEAMLTDSPDYELHRNVRKVAQIALDMRGIEQRCDFFAKYLVERQMKLRLYSKFYDTKVRVLIGTPYFVAVAD